jgi:hypothetical protein
MEGATRTIQIQLQMNRFTSMSHTTLLTPEMLNMSHRHRKIEPRLENDSTEFDTQITPEDVKRKLDNLPSSEQRDDALTIPWENHVGVVLGGQFKLGNLIRQEPHADVYEVEPLLWNTTNKLEAKAYTLHGLSPRMLDVRRRNMRRLDGPLDPRKVTSTGLPQRRVICRIDQAFKKFLVYIADSDFVDPSKRRRNAKSQNSQLATGKGIQTASSLSIKLILNFGSDEADGS